MASALNRDDIVHACMQTRLRGTFGLEAISELLNGLLAGRQATSPLQACLVYILSPELARGLLRHLHGTMNFCFCCGCQRMQGPCSNLLQQTW